MPQRRKDVAKDMIWDVHENASLDLCTRGGLGAHVFFLLLALVKADEMNYLPEWSLAFSSPALLPEEILDRKGHILLPTEPCVSRLETTSHGYR